MSQFKTHGTGRFNRRDFSKIGQNVVIESGVLIFHPENIEIGDNVYIGHNTILKGYYNQKMVIGNDVWIGQNCYFFSAGKIEIKEKVGIGPGVQILTSVHDLSKDNLGPIIDLPLSIKPVTIEKKVDIGIGVIILPGVNISEGTQVGAGAVVTKDTFRYSIVAGIPAKKIGVRQNIFNQVHKQTIKPNQIIFSSCTNILRYVFDLVLFIFLPVLIIPVWSRLGWKRLFKQKPRILISPLGNPMPYFMVKAIRTQGYKADNLAFDCHSYFRAVSFGPILADHFALRIFVYLTDYTILFAWAILNFDIFEFPFCGGLLMNSHLRKLELLLLKICAKKISVYGYGSDCQTLSQVREAGYKYNTAMDRREETESWTDETIRHNVARVQKFADVIVAGADLIYLGKKAIMLPLALDLEFWKYKPLHNNKILIIIHSTNHRSFKGTRFIIDTVAMLKKRLPVEMRILEKKTISECQKLYPQGDLFITDVITGWHGFTAIEAMAIGRPVITYLRPDIAKFHHYYAKTIPAVSANPDNLASAITRLVKNEKLRQKLSQEGRRYVEKYHSLEFVGALRNIIYEYIWAGKKINQKIFEKEIKKRGLI